MPYVGRFILSDRRLTMDDPSQYPFDGKRMIDGSLKTLLEM